MEKGKGAHSGEDRTDLEGLSLNWRTVFFSVSNDETLDKLNSLRLSFLIIESEKFETSLATGDPV